MNLRRSQSECGTRAGAGGRGGQRGFTLTESVVTMAIVGVVFLAFGMFSIQALRTFKWLTATNIAHQQARQGIQRMLVDIHNSPSPLMLVNVRGESAPAAGTHWGVVYQRMLGGPYQVGTSLSAGDTTLDLLVGNAFTPQVGQMILIPNSVNLYTITNVGALGNGMRTVSFTPPLTTNDVLDDDAGYDPGDSGSGGNRAIGAYISVRSAFLVREGADGDYELRHYPVLRAGSQANGVLQGENAGGDQTYYVPQLGGSPVNAIDNPNTYDVVSRGLRAVSDGNTTVAPFSDPFLSTGVTNRRAVAAVQLSLQDSAVSELIADEQARYHLNSTTIFLNSMIPQKHLTTQRN